MSGISRTLSQTRERRRTRNALVIVQTALAVVLLIASGLMIRTFQSLRRVDPGFRATGLQTFRMFRSATAVKEPVEDLKPSDEALRGATGLARAKLEYLKRKNEIQPADVDTPEKRPVPEPKTRFPGPRRRGRFRERR